MEKRVLVYQAYGSQDIIKQTIFSVCSFLKACTQPELIEIHIFTNKPEDLEKFFLNYENIKVRKVTVDRIEQLKGPKSFVHRFKVELLLAVSREFKGPLYYSDGDTIYLSDPIDLFLKVNDRSSLMHIDEGIIGKNKDPLSKKIAKFLKHRKFHISGQDVVVGPSTKMWNAGFIGMSHKNKSLLPRVLELTDRLYGEYQKHIMEQLAFSFLLQTSTQIFAAESVILHYWNNKEIFQKAINEFLAQHQTAEEAVRNWQNWKPPTCPQKASKPWSKKILDPIKKFFSQPNS